MTIRASWQPWLLGPLAALAMGQAGIAQAKPLGTGFCADALGGGKADQAWSTTLQQLRQGRRPAVLPDCPCFAGRPANLSELTPDQGYGLMIRQGFRREVLLDGLRRAFHTVIRRDQELGLQRYQNLAWAGVYLSEAALLAYERSGDERFLELFVAYFDRVLERRDQVLQRRDDFRGELRQGWGSSKVDADRWINLVTHNGRIVYPATRFALLVRDKPGLSRFQAKAAQYTAISQAVLDEFEREWQPLASGDHWFRRPPLGEPEATNRIHLVGRSWINLARLTGEERYRQRVQSLITLFQQGVHPQADGSLSWISSTGAGEEAAVQKRVDTEVLQCSFSFPLCLLLVSSTAALYTPFRLWTCYLRFQLFAALLYCRISACCLAVNPPQVLRSVYSRQPGGQALEQEAYTSVTYHSRRLRGAGGRGGHVEERRATELTHFHCLHRRHKPAAHQF